MKKHIPILLPICIFIFGCTNNKVIQSKQAVIDSLSREVSILQKENDELKHGEERLVNYIQTYLAAGQYIKAEEAINMLKEKHPESPSLKKYLSDLPNIEKNVRQEREIKEKAIKDSIRLANINELGIWQVGEFVNHFGEPTGEKFISAQIEGSFENSATAYGKLLVRLRITKYENNSYGLNMSCDEYMDGTIDGSGYGQGDNFIVSKERRKAYRYRGSSCFDQEGDETIDIVSLLRNESIYFFKVHYEYSTRYYYTIDSKYLNNAFLKAGFENCS